jgi:predicted nucleic-acid-binding Zn-ribbon protein
MSKCVKCENTVFGIQEISPSGAQYKMYVVQCVVFLPNSAMVHLR